MRRLGVLMLVALGSATGCGPSSDDLRERTISSMNVLADTWDGAPTFQAVGLDAYGHPLSASVTEGLVNYNLEIRSNGPDGLPKNRDDLVVQRDKPHGKPKVQQGIEKASESMGRGGIRGAIQGAKEGLIGKSRDKPAK